MLHSLKTWFEEQFLPAAGGEDKEIMLQRAAAVLLCEIMHADHAIDSSEQAIVINAMQSFLEMHESDANKLYAEIGMLMQDALSIHEFTSLLNTYYDETKKLKLMEWLWKVAYADGRMDAHEEHLVRRIADLLYIRHSDYIRIRNQVCNQA